MTSKVRTVKYDARMVRCGAVRCAAQRCDAADFGRHFGDRPWSSNLNDPSDTQTHTYTSGCLWLTFFKNVRVNVVVILDVFARSARNDVRERSFM